MKHNTTSRWARQGSLVAELLVALVICMATMAAATQLLALAMSQHRLEDARLVADIEVANVMEELMALPWERVTPDRRWDRPLSPDGQRVLDDAQLRIVVTDIEGQPAARHLKVVVEWQREKHGHGRAAQLEAWKFKHSGEVR